MPYFVASHSSHGSKFKEANTQYVKNKQLTHRNLQKIYVVIF